MYGSPFWCTFVRELERRLLTLQVKTRGCADGDLALPGCVYTSLRNEAYVRVSTRKRNNRNKRNKNKDNDDDDDDKNNCDNDDDDDDPDSDELQYPPNSVGWNAASHPNPFLDVIYMLNLLAPFVVTK